MKVEECNAERRGSAGVRDPDKRRQVQVEVRVTEVCWTGGGKEQADRASHQAAPAAETQPARHLTAHTALSPLGLFGWVTSPSCLEAGRCLSKMTILALNSDSTDQMW